MNRHWVVTLTLLGVLSGGPAVAEPQAAVAGVLGLIPGFGTGYWYAGHQGKGLTFTVVDLGLTVGAVVAVDHGVDDLFSGGNGFALGNALAWARIASGIYQCVDGVITVNRDNRGGNSLTELRRPPTFGWQVGLGDFAGATDSSLAAGSWSRRYEPESLALSYRYSQTMATQPTYLLSLNAAELGATFSFHQQF